MQLDVPQKTGVAGLAAAAKTVFGAVLVGDVGVKLDSVSEPTLDGITGPEAIFAKFTEQDLSKVFEISEVLAPFVAAGRRIDTAAAAKVVPNLPDPSSPSFAAAYVFGDFYALVAAKGKLALSAELELTMWYQRLLGNTRVKQALTILTRVEVDKAEAPKAPTEVREAVKAVEEAKSEPSLEPKEPKVPKETKVEPKAEATEAKIEPKIETKEPREPKDEPKVDAKDPEAKKKEPEPKAAAVPAALPVKEAPKETKEEKPFKVQPIDTSKPVELLKKPEHPILPKKGEKNYLITSALPYVNNVPHLGNIIGSTLSADFFARWTKGRGYNSLYICGTDEYGTATETKAIEEKVTPLELCTKYHRIHKEVYDWFQIGFDHFGRTSTPQQTEIAQEIFLAVRENGFLEEKSMEQLYCPQHQGYLADRFVEGTCPKCGYDDARGDQCDSCGQLLDPFELINPRCKLDNASPERRETKHLFISLDKLQPEVEKWVKSREGTWSNNARQITNSWLKEGLQPRAITRDLKWGVPVPVEGYEDKVLYVWFDAPIGYPSITACYTDEWRQWWNNPEHVDLYQFMGKDNVPFHTVIFPASEMGTRKNWTMLKTLSTTEYLQYEGGKFSKSRSLGVFGNNAQDIGVSPSVWRYYLASVRPESADAQFSWSEFVTRNNSELLANFGNLVNRVVKFTIAKFDGVVPQYDVTSIGTYPEFASQVTELIQLYNSFMERCELRSGLETVMRISSRGNQFLQDNKLDNTLLETEPKKCAAVIGTALSLIYILSAISAPFMPEASEKILEQLNLPARIIPDEFDLGVPGNTKLGAAQYLFTRIDKAKIEEWQSKFGGNKEAKEEEKPKKKKKKSKKKKATGEGAAGDAGDAAEEAACDSKGSATSAE